MARKTLIVLLAAVFALAGSGCFENSPAANPAAGGIPGKAKQAETLIRQKASTGADVSGDLEAMSEVSGLIKQKDFAAAEARLDEIIASLEGGEASTADAPADAEFGSPVRVEIRGYDGGTMEPFISRDGHFLLFNSAKDAFGTGSKPPDLHYARRIDDSTFEYAGPLEGANSPDFDGGPTMDRDGQLYFSSTRDYGKRLATIYTGRFDGGGNVSGVDLAAGDLSKQQAGWLNMDAEISADGRTLYFADNQWDTRNKVPKSGDLHIATDVNGEFRRIGDSAKIMATINTEDLEYAAGISEDELEIFFNRTRFSFRSGKLAGADTRIMVATRASTTEPFGEPRQIESITGFVEGPTISPDGRNLYYHKKEQGQYRIYRVTRQ